MVVNETEILGNCGFEECDGAREIPALGAGVEVESELAFYGCFFEVSIVKFIGTLTILLGFGFLGFELVSWIFYPSPVKPSSANLIF